MIDRADMLELTRRMTLTRTCFSRVAGAYMTDGGEIDETFNTAFLSLDNGEKTRQLALAKTVPFAKTNEQLVERRFPESGKGANSMWSLLMRILACGLKNDLLMEALYEQIGIFYESDGPYGINISIGSYDVPMKSTDGGYLYESEVVYDFMVCAVSPLKGSYEPGKPEYGFLFPAFSYRSGDRDAIDIFNRDPDHPQTMLTEMLLGER